MNGIGFDIVLIDNTWPKFIPKLYFILVTTMEATLIIIIEIQNKHKFVKLETVLLSRRKLEIMPLSSQD